MEENLWWAVHDKKEEEVRRILQENREVNVGWRNQSHFGCAALHIACRNNDARIAALLLAHPGIDVNQKKDGGDTPFLTACDYGGTACVRLLLRDPRVDPNQPEADGKTPLWCAAGTGHPAVIRWWIASGREMNLGEPGNPETDAIGKADRRGNADVVLLLRRFRDDPEGTRRQLRKVLGCFDEMAAELFALVIFLCDGLLEIKEESMTGAGRFLAMARRLPIELQMVLCYRAVGSMRMNIPGEVRELAFRSLS